MSLERKNPAGVAPPLGPYTHVTVVPAGSELLVFAGQVGMDREGRLPTEPEEQLRNALANVAALLASEGLGPQDLVKVNLWLSERMDRDRLLAIWHDFRGGAEPPPTTLVYVAGLVRPEYYVEVEAWAARRK
ncbi:RidA family protein [Aggregicoccus sp. 17bor-14]|uniref:RidA family protein n=1 Tax=Myxococcaceae TaxID=31 RepID=UPI00129C7411|nr:MULTISPECIES: RidA family protein [Myxococcaceae]MBF5040987.1 RidA family protein [Simulacricoccus sp. 17bor-14]MRI86774.1 RidA family protein [Aggregicoccus sp. 17bor-14]